MTEQEIRTILSSVCEQLDDQAERIAKRSQHVLLPFAAGMCIAMGVGCSKDTGSDPVAKEPAKSIDLPPPPPYGAVPPPLPSEAGPAPSVSVRHPK